MQIFLGVFMVLAVSGGEEVTADEEVAFDSILDSSVLLQCPCPNRNKDKDFKWQKEEPAKFSVFSYSTSEFNDTYRGRAKTFVAEDKYNCSLLLTNITVDDRGKYRCSFFNDGTYNRYFVNLKVYASYNVCQNTSATNPNDSAKVFHCDVKGRYRDTEIQWYLDSELLTNSSTTTITNTYVLDDLNRLYSFSSKLITERRGMSEPRCAVKAKDISTNSTCIRTAIRVGSEPKYFKRYLKMIPIVLVLGFSLVLWCRWKHLQGLQKMRTVKTDYFNC